MSDLADDLRHALAQAARASRLLVASDFDGTLAPIVNNPADARPLPGASVTLRALADLPRNARSYLDFLQERSGAPFSAVGVGPGRDETVVVRPLV